MSEHRASGRRAERTAGACLTISAVASVCFAIAVALGSTAQVEGIALVVALAGLAFGLVVWSLSVLPHEQVEDTRKVDTQRPLPDEDALPRTAFLLRAFYAAIGALGIATLFPFRALAPAYGQGLYRTKWTPGARLVQADGSPLSPSDLELGSVTTVFPEHFTGDAESATLLLRIGPEAAVPAQRASWSPRGCIAFSKICTHAGCPVGVYRQRSQQLLCPCHQSVFDVTGAGAPVSGPATRALPQLPLKIGIDGYLRAASDFLEPVGPGFWNRS